MNKKIIFLDVMMLLLSWVSLFGILVKLSFGDVPTTNVPLFELLSKEVTEFNGGVNVTLTFRNYGFDATSGIVWMPWEKVWYSVPLNGTPPNGSLSEALLPFDINGDGDTSGVFVVQYIDNETVEIDGVTANAMFIREQRIPYDRKGFYDVREKNSFKLGSKNHTLDHVRYDPEYESGCAGFGLDSFFRYHPSPNIEFFIEQTGTSINSNSTAEIISVELNGILIPYEFNLISPWLDGSIGIWYVDNMYVYPLSFLSSNAVFTVRLSIQGEPGYYMLYTILNWAPDALHRYMYFVTDATDTAFAITGTVHREVIFGNETYDINILTNSTVSQTITFNWMAKEISFNATCYGGLTFFWNITIPQNLLRDSPWTVTLDGSPITYIPTTNGTHTFVYFNFTYPQPSWFVTSKVSITGTWVVSEFPSAMIPPIFMLLSLLIITNTRRKYRKPKI